VVLVSALVVVLAGAVFVGYGVSVGFTSRQLVHPPCANAPGMPFYRVPPASTDASSDAVGWLEVNRRFFLPYRSTFVDRSGRRTAVESWQRVTDGPWIGCTTVG